MAVEEDLAICCTSLIIIIVIIVVIWIIAKGAGVLGSLGQWRTGSALKHMSREGMLVRQEPAYYPPQQAYAPSAPPPGGGRFCPYCGQQAKPGGVFCPSCGKRTG